MRPNVKRRKARLIHAGAGALVVALPATAVALTARPLSSPHAVANAGRSNARFVVTKPAARTAKRRGCGKLFTVAMGERAPVPKRFPPRTSPRARRSPPRWRAPRT
jgi:hypothetical protein